MTPGELLKLKHILREVDEDLVMEWRCKACDAFLAELYLRARGMAVFRTKCPKCRQENLFSWEGSLDKIAE